MNPVVNTPEYQEAMSAANKEIDKLKKMKLDQLRRVAAEHDFEPPENVSKAWLARKCGRLVQARILKERGIEMTETVAQNDAATDAAQTEETQKKPGRKRMATSGTFKLQIAEGQSEGRAGSCRNHIVTSLKGKEFTYEEFGAVVNDHLGWDEEKKAFTKNASKFKDLAQATRAWFSELKGTKNNMIVQVTTGEATE